MGLFYLAWYASLARDLFRLSRTDLGITGRAA